MTAKSHHRWVASLAAALLVGLASLAPLGRAADGGMADVVPRPGFPCPTGMIWATVDGKARCVWCDPNAQPGADTQSLTCSTGFSGSITQTRTYTCNQATNSWVAGSWTTVANTCAQSDCVGARPADETRTVSCPNSWDSGQITETRSYSCGGAAAGWAYVAGPWTESSSTCLGCNPASQPTSARSVACPSGQTGSISQARDVWCQGSTWTTGNWYETGNNCQTQATCTGPAPAGTQTVACPSGQTGSISQARDVWCQGSTWATGNWYETSYNCQTQATCDPNAQPAGTQTVACPSGQTGSISQARDVWCSGTTWQTANWYETGRTCAVADPGCGAGPVYWGNCTGSVGGGLNGAVQSVGNTASGYSGSSSWYCGNGAWGYSGGTCDPVATCPPPRSIISGTCQCPSGQTWNGSQCVSTVRYVWRFQGGQGMGGIPGWGAANRACMGKEIACPDTIGACSAARLGQVQFRACGCDQVEALAGDYECVAE